MEARATSLSSGEDVSRCALRTPVEFLGGKPPLVWWQQLPHVGVCAHVLTRVLAVEACRWDPRARRASQYPAQIYLLTLGPRRPRQAMAIRMQGLVAAQQTSSSCWGAAALKTGSIRPHFGDESLQLQLLVALL